jgi:hypothetical protein
MSLANTGFDHDADRRSQAAFTWHAPIAARSRLALAPALAIIVALGCPAPGRAAGLVISAPVITASPGASGSFLVLLTDTDLAGSMPYNVTGDQFELTLTGSAAITFTAVTTATDVSPYNAPYLYANSTDNDYSIPLYASPTNPFPTTDFMAADTFDVGKSPGYTTLNPGDVYAMALVSYSISPTATAGSGDTIGFPAANTLLTGNIPDAIVPTMIGGSITIAAVPEPSTLAMGILAVAIAPLVARLCRRARQTNRAR